MTFTGPHTPDAKARIAAALKGRPRPPEVRAKIAASMTGKEPTREHKIKQRYGIRRWKLANPEAWAERCQRSRERMTARWAARRATIGEERTE